jgi:hypothetical protein
MSGLKKLTFKRLQANQALRDVLAEMRSLSPQSEDRLRMATTQLKYHKAWRASFPTNSTPEALDASSSC